MTRLTNEKIELYFSKHMNDLDIINDVLDSEKSISNFINLILNDSSNKVLYNLFFKIYEETKKTVCDIKDLKFKNGWSSLEIASEDKISHLINNSNIKLKEL